MLSKPSTVENFVSEVQDVLDSQPPALGTQTERRRKMRYPIEVNVYYRAIEHKHGIYRTGRTINLSSGGVRVVTRQEHHLRTGTKVEIKIEWTYPLNGTVPLNLVAIGTVARREQFSFAATFERHEFRIARQPLQCSLMQSA
jgi:hypothetical protein